MRGFRFYSVLLLMAIFFFESCEKNSEKEPIASEDSIYVYVNNVMNYWYLWNDKVPQVDIFSYNEPADLLDDLRYKTYDKWSFMGKTEEILALFNEGQLLSFGFYFRWDAYAQLWVDISYPNSDAYKQGITRGCRILEIDDVKVENITSFNWFFDDSPRTTKFKYQDPDGVISDVTISKKEITLNGVLYKNTYNVSGKKTGYLVYDSFLGYSEEELINAMQFFKNESVDELIIDLRYNGGGLVTISEMLADIIAPSDALGKVFYIKSHNKDRAVSNNSISLIEYNELNLDLDRVFFITTDHSASASELLINGLEPHMDVYVIGEKTSGKPVGMYGFEFQDWLMLPITNITENANGFGSYFDGLPVDKEARDGIEFPWGSETEPCLHQAFHYISYGKFDDEIAVAFKTTETQQVEFDIPHKQNLMIFEK